MMRVFTAALVLIGLGVTGGMAEDKVDFAKQVLPILKESCGKCHGEKKASAKLRLDSAAGLKAKWDEQKNLIEAGKPEASELFKRITLPAGNKKLMPKGGEPLAKDKIDLIGRWIKEGAVLPVAAAVATTATPAKPTEGAAAKKAEPKKPAELPLPKVSAAPKDAVDKLTAAGAQVMPLFSESSLLQVSFAHRGTPAGDSEVALLAGVAEQVYALNLADSKATDAGLAQLAKLKNLATLHLERSSITDAGLAHVAALGNLQYLNLYGTGITDAGIKQLKTAKNLRKLYLWQTKASYDVAMGLEKDIPGLEVNLGYNHPVVAKMRLTKELETAKKQDEEAKADLAKLQSQLDAAKKNAEAATAHVTDVQKQLTELDPAAAAKAAEEAKKQAAAKAEAAKKADAAKPKTGKGGKKAKAKAEAEKVAAEKSAAEKAAAEKKAADAKAAAEKAAADAKAAADKAAADAKATADKASAEAKAAGEAKAAADAKAAAAAKAAADAKAAAEKLGQKK